MTWRRFSHSMLWVSIFTMALVWMFANTHRTRYICGSPTRLRGVTMLHGSIELFSAPQREAGARMDSWSEFMLLGSRYRHPWGTWAYIETPVRRRADYSTGPPVPGMPPSPVVEDWMWSLKIPVWVLWFPAAACIVAFCRIMEKCSGSGKEKELAEGSDGDGDAISDPDASAPADSPRGKSGSPANIPLAISGVLLLLTSFIDTLPGGYWPLHCISAAFALWGMKEADTPRHRTTAILLTTLCVTCAMMDVLVSMAGG